MPLYGQIVFGCLAIFAVCMIVRSIRTGLAHSRGVTFDIGEQPIRFSLMLAVQLLILAFCVWCAAGYDPAMFWEAVGIPTG